MTLKRRGGHKEIVAAEGLPRPRRSAPQAHGALVLAIVRGHRWKELLERGRYVSIDALARAWEWIAPTWAATSTWRCSRRYRGGHPHRPGAGRALPRELFRLPLEWGEQRRALHMG